MDILFVHPNMPGQYKHLARVLADDPRNRVAFITLPNEARMAGVKKIEFTVARKPTPGIHHYVAGLETAVVRGQAVWKVCDKLKRSGFTPDIICAHPGWGDGLFLKDIYPDTPLLSFMEFYYIAGGADVGFDPDEPVTEDAQARIRIKNATNLFNLEACDWAISPTFWQAGLHPAVFHTKLSVLHDGIDTQIATPADFPALTLDNGVTLRREDEIVTYIARNLEPYRGFPTFMRAAEIIQRRRPQCRIVVVGSDGVSYGKRPKGSKTYRQQMLEQVTLDPERIHFLGRVPYTSLIRLLQISGAHVYLTMPFVLSWSMMEAMACGCLIIGSDTQPVREVITHGQNGLLVDFFSPEQLADAVDEVFAHRDRMRALREAAQRTIVENYALEALLPLHLSLVEDLAARRLPPPIHDTIRARYPADVAARIAAPGLELPIQKKRMEN